MHSKVSTGDNYLVINLTKEYKGDHPYSGDVIYGVISNLSEEDLTTIEELKPYMPFVVISTEMYEVIRESNNNDERECKRDALYHDSYAINDERVSTLVIDPSKEAESNYTYNHILEAIMKLPKLHGRRFYQRYILELSVKDISTIENKDESTIYESLRKSKKVIHSVFVEEGVAA